MINIIFQIVVYCYNSFFHNISINSGNIGIDYLSQIRHNRVQLGILTPCNMNGDVRDLEVPIKILLAAKSSRKKKEKK